MIEAPLQRQEEAGCKRRLLRSPAGEAEADAHQEAQRKRTVPCWYSELSSMPGEPKTNPISEHSERLISGSPKPGGSLLLLLYCNA